jgi:hypothetical protein
MKDGPVVLLLLNLALAFCNVGTIWAHEIDIRSRQWCLVCASVRIAIAHKAQFSYPRFDRSLISWYWFTPKKGEHTQDALSVLVHARPQATPYLLLDDLGDGLQLLTPVPCLCGPYTRFALGDGTAH